MKTGSQWLKMQTDNACKCNNGQPAWWALAFLATCHLYNSTPCLKKTVQNCFCQNLVEFPPILIIFGRKMPKRLKLCEMHLFSTSPNSCHHTTVLNANVRNCYTTLKVVICSKLSNDLNSTSIVKRNPFGRIISSYNRSVQNSEFMLGVGPRTRTQALRRPRHRKREAAFTASRFLWRRRICGFTGICHCTWVKGLKCTVVCYFQGRIFYPTNLLNHVAPFIELMMQMWAI